VIPNRTGQNTTLYRWESCKICLKFLNFQHQHNPGANFIKSIQKIVLSDYDHRMYNIILSLLTMAMPFIIKSLKFRAVSYMRLVPNFSVHNSGTAHPQRQIQSHGLARPRRIHILWFKISVWLCNCTINAKIYLLRATAASNGVRCGKNNLMILTLKYDIKSVSDSRWHVRNEKSFLSVRRVDM
jgi:hypothetical protein